MSKFYALARIDGGVEIMNCVDDTTDPIAEINRWSPDHRALMVGTAKEIKSVPQDRSFRNAWTPALTVDMPKAREIHMGRIRAARDDELRHTDGLMARATEQGNTTEGAKLRIERQRLRDIPQNFVLSGATTADDLKALWPKALKVAG